MIQTRLRLKVPASWSTAIEPIISFDWNRPLSYVTIHSCRNTLNRRNIHSVEYQRCLFGFHQQWSEVRNHRKCRQATHLEPKPFCYARVAGGAGMTSAPWHYDVTIHDVTTSLTCLRGCVVVHTGRLYGHGSHRTVQNLGGRVAPTPRARQLVQQRRLPPEIAAADDVFCGGLPAEALPADDRGAEITEMLNASLGRPTFSVIVQWLEGAGWEWK